MIERLRDALASAGIEWTVDGDKRHPNETDIQDALDDLAVRLIGGTVGDRLSIGGLVVEKRSHGVHDVYVYIGEFV